MRLTQVLGRNVVDTTTATSVGALEGFVVDLSTAGLLALVVRTGRRRQVVLWDEVLTIGPDAITTVHVPVSDRVAPGGLLVDRSLLTTRVLTDQGDAAGILLDAELNPADGVLAELLTTTRAFPGRSLIADGSYAVMVRDSG